MENKKRFSRNRIEGFTRYHFAFCARHRRKVFEIPGFNQKLKYTFLQTCSDHQFELAAFNPHSEYIHIILITPPFVDHSEAMLRIKTESKYLKGEFSELTSMPNLWTRAYFVSTEKELPQKDVLLFVSNQKKS